METNAVYMKLPDGSKRPIQGCLFDFDGVVVDTESYHFRSWNYGGQYIHTELTWQEYLPLKSTGTTYIANCYGEKAGLSLSQEDIRMICRRKEESFQELILQLSKKDILSGVEDFLAWLKEHRIRTAMASSSHTSIQIAKEFGLDRYFDAMFDGNTKMPRKPAPDVFLTAAKAIGLERNGCIVFEDSLAGIGAAVNAGMPVIAVGGIHSNSALAHISDFSQIQDLFSTE